MNHYLLLAATDATAEGSILDTILSFAPIIVVLAVFYFLLILPQKKKEKAERKMRENLEIGDEVVTVGGIIGLVVSVKEDTVVLETGSDRSKIRLAKWAISQNITASENAKNEK